MKGAPEARERLHFLGFVGGRKHNSYKVEALGASIDFIGNPNLFKESEELKAAMASWPFQPARLINNLPS
jgi:hypothetical protein